MRLWHAGVVTGLELETMASRIIGFDLKAQAGLQGDPPLITPETAAQPQARKEVQFPNRAPMEGRKTIQPGSITVLGQFSQRKVITETAPGKGALQGRIDRNLSITGPSLVLKRKSGGQVQALIKAVPQAPPQGRRRVSKVPLNIADITAGTGRPQFHVAENSSVRAEALFHVSDEMMKAGMNPDSRGSSLLARCLFVGANQTKNIVATVDADAAFTRACSKAFSIAVNEFKFLNKPNSEK